MKSNVHVASIGLISAIGNSVEQTLASFSNHVCGIGPLTLFDSIHNDLPVGQVKFSNKQLAKVLGASKQFNRTTLLGIYAARQAWNKLKLPSKWKTGIVSGTTVGGMDRSEVFFQDYLQKGNADFQELRDHECGRVTECIAEDLGVLDVITTINTACSSSVNSIMYGARLIKHGFLDIALVGGVDSLTKFTLNGFNSLMILDSDLCTPFDADRKGLNLGEGAGFLALVSEKVLKEESLSSLCKVVGYANSNDAFHQTASSPNGHGSYLAMEGALKMSGLPAGEIDYINLHGTGTKNNDSSEGIAVQQLFGEQVPFVSSTKSFTGHTLGASGGLEAVFSVMAIEHSCIFPNLRFNSRMPEVNFDPVTEFKNEISIKNVMSNSFGFGGNCSSIIFSKEK